MDRKDDPEDKSLPSASHSDAAPAEHSEGALLDSSRSTLDASAFAEQKTADISATETDASESTAGSSAMRLYRRSAQRSRRQSVETADLFGESKTEADGSHVTSAVDEVPRQDENPGQDEINDLNEAETSKPLASVEAPQDELGIEPPPLPPEAVIHPVKPKLVASEKDEASFENERRVMVGRRYEDQPVQDQSVQDQSGEIEDLAARAEARDQARRAEMEARMTPRVVAHNTGLEVRSLGKQFKRRPVLRDVSLSVQRGEAVGLLGPNGAGKTTCFYIITGLISADYGEIFLDGQDITELPMYRRARLGVGYLPQEASIFRGLTVEDNIRAVLELIEKNRDRREATLDALLAEFSISHLRRTPAIALSGGERRRLEIARALATQPNFILLDEPLAGIDPIAVRDIRELVRHLKDRGIGVLITDHNVRETLDIVDRAYILHDGGVLMEGMPHDIVANEDVRRVYLGDRFTL